MVIKAVEAVVVVKRLRLSHRCPHLLVSDRDTAGQKKKLRSSSRVYSNASHSSASLKVHARAQEIGSHPFSQTLDSGAMMLFSYWSYKGARGYVPNQSRCGQGMSLSLGL